eukprot:16017269-Heterocapsa_arctica.AAC.1
MALKVFEGFRRSSSRLRASSLLSLEDWWPATEGTRSSSTGRTSPAWPAAMWRVGVRPGQASG